MTGRAIPYEVREEFLELVYGELSLRTAAAMVALSHAVGPLW
jgi:hypothetical protein